MSEKVAVYPGSFNPVHPGHLHVIRQAAQVFDRVIVLIAENPEKSYPINPNGQQNKRACKVRAMYNLDTCNRQRIKRCMATQRLAGDGLTKDVTVKYMKALMSKYHLEHKDECKELSDDYYEV